VRIDRVYQSDEDGMKAADHITRMDSISQWQVEACVPGISEAFLRPLLERVIAQFPFVIEGFHSDNGSGYINCQIAKMLGKLRIESVWGNCCATAVLIRFQIKRVREGEGEATTVQMYG
jgi:hypothetical protein